MGITMSASLASTESSSDSCASNLLLVTDAMTRRACRGTAHCFLTDVGAVDRVEAPPLRDQILAMVAHELRGPLTPLRMASEMIRSASAERPDILRLIDMIDRQVNGIARLAQDLMDATRVERGAFRLDKIDLEIATLVADSCEITAAAAAAKNQSFTVSIPDRTLRVEGDPVRLTQAVSNMLHNAVKYTPARGTIRMTVFAESNNVVINIKDDGSGISPELLPHIFELFAQSSRTIASSAGGLGIGLAVVNAIAQSHGGSVSAASAGPGKGSEFTLKLPMARAARAA